METIGEQLRGTQSRRLRLNCFSVWSGSHSIQEFKAREKLSFHCSEREMLHYQKQFVSCLIFVHFMLIWDGSRGEKNSVKQNLGYLSNAIFIFSLRPLPVVLSLHICQIFGTVFFFPKSRSFCIFRKETTGRWSDYVAFSPDYCVIQFKLLCYLTTTKRQSAKNCRENEWMHSNSIMGNYLTCKLTLFTNRKGRKV